MKLFNDRESDIVDCINDLCTITGKNGLGERWNRNGSTSSTYFHGNTSNEATISERRPIGPLDQKTLAAGDTGVMLSRREVTQFAIDHFRDPLSGEVRIPTIGCSAVEWSQAGFFQEIMRAPEHTQNCVAALAVMIRTCEHEKCECALCNASGGPYMSEFMRANGIVVDREESVAQWKQNNPNAPAYAYYEHFRVGLGIGLEKIVLADAEVVSKYRIFMDMFPIILQLRDAMADSQRKLVAAARTDIGDGGSFDHQGMYYIPEMWACVCSISIITHPFALPTSYFHSHKGTPPELRIASNDLPTAPARAVDASRATSVSFSLVIDAILCCITTITKLPDRMEARKETTQVR